MSAFVEIRSKCGHDRPAHDSVGRESREGSSAQSIGNAIVVIRLFPAFTQTVPWLVIRGSGPVLPEDITLRNRPPGTANARTHSILLA